jgi:hypothetical protein
MSVIMGGRRENDAVGKDDSVADAVGDELVVLSHLGVWKGIDAVLNAAAPVLNETPVLDETPVPSGISVFARTGETVRVMNSLLVRRTVVV